uniref:Reverse transcriptase domain-containing protein n=2 Tax=Photinus pyralis TaxID=7054 RepID=A0A1Y1L8P1_PHOPY
MVNSRLSWWLEKYNLLVPYQMGFRKNRSTVDQLTFVENYIQNSFKSRQRAVAIFFDIEKAYDMAWRYNILHQLYSWGFRGNLPRFIESFLSDRWCQVRVGNTLSERQFLENGIPQGSTLSCTLFGIAINSISENVNSAIGRCLYVDDLCIISSGDTIGAITRKLQPSIESIYNTAKNIGFVLSRSKTKCMHFCRLRRPHYDPLLFIAGEPIPCVVSHKFLGMILDSKLNWKQHIDCLVRKCKSRLNVIKFLSSTRWGADTRILIRIYKSLVMSQLDYACVAYSSARPSLLRKLDTVHNLGLRYCLGAFPTTPVMSLYCESSVEPLYIRRTKMILTYTLAIRANHQHRNCVMLTEIDNSYQQKPTITRPLSIRANEIEQETNMSACSVYPDTIRETPPWLYPSINIRLDLTVWAKQNHLPAEMKRRLFEILAELSPDVTIYTDGSRTEYGVGCSIAIGKIAYAWSLSPKASIFTAEQYAIWQALRYCEINPNLQSVVIASDSLSSLTSLQNLASADILTKMCQETVIAIASNGTVVTFVWIPAHVGILGNEVADRAAKRAASEIEIDVPEIKKSDQKVYILQRMKELWQQSWQENNTFLTQIKPSVVTTSPALNLPRQESVRLHRLRMGHTAITHTYLLKGENPPLCDLCNNAMSVEHILCNCPAQTVQRNLCDVPQNLENCLTDVQGIKSTILYLKQSSYFTKI